MGFRIVERRIGFRIMGFRIELRIGFGVVGQRRIGFGVVG
jgi:hypothetical protein